MQHSRKSDEPQTSLLARADRTWVGLAWVALDSEWRKLGRTKRKLQCRRDTFNTGCRAHFIERLPIESQKVRILRILRGGKG